MFSENHDLPSVCIPQFGHEKFHLSHHISLSYFAGTSQ